MSTELKNNLQHAPNKQINKEYTSHSKHISIKSIHKQQTQQKSMSEQNQSDKLSNKYGGLPSKKGILNKRMKGQTDRTFFDSADHFSGKQTGSETRKPSPNSQEVKTNDTAPSSTTTATTTTTSAVSSTTTTTSNTNTNTSGSSSGVEATQAAKLSNKYGGLPSKKGILNKRMKGQNERTYFDSADHFSGKNTGSQTKSPVKAKGNPALAHLKK